MKGTIINPRYNLLDIVVDFSHNFNPFYLAALYHLKHSLTKSLDSNPKSAILNSHFTLPSRALSIFVLNNTLACTDAMNGLKPEIFYNATSKDLEKVLKDNTYENITLIGHGNKNLWDATDKIVDIKTLDEIEFERKLGYITKLTCSGGDSDEFALRIAKDHNNVRYYNGKVRGFPIYRFAREEFDKAISTYFGLEKHPKPF